MVRVCARQWHERVMWTNLKHRRATTPCEANEGIILAVSEGEVKQVGSGCLRRMVQLLQLAIDAVPILRHFGNMFGLDHPTVVVEDV